MKRSHSLLLVILLTGLVATGQQQPQGATRPRLYNTAKQKLLDGKQVFSASIYKFDPDLYCQSARHYDYVWLEMQHSTMSWAEIEKMIAACPKVGVPMVRLPDEFESTIQKATDVGVLGVIEPTVDTVEKAQALVRYSKYPFEGRRSRGSAQATTIWGPDYRQTANDNMLVVVMIETPVGVANAYDIARVPGVDVVLAANNDLGNFSGSEQGTPEYEVLVDKIHDATLKAGKIFGVTDTPYGLKRKDSADIRFFQGGKSNDGWQPPARPGRGGRGSAQ
jgi:4-hydroxy-2-oxoheptanedioate aldolase